jgi:hypothetical protein
MRRWLFAEVANTHQLDGVLLAHHADDQAETVMQRLLRGSGVRGLRGMAERSVQKVDGQRLVLYRPLLSVRREELREYLRERGEEWREDSSNRSAKYFRNRLRGVLAEQVELGKAMLELERSCQQLSKWVAANSPTLGNPFKVSEMWNVPGILAREMGREYLRGCGCPGEEITPRAVERLMEMANDAATPARQVFPGNVYLRRTQGKISRQPG